MTDFAVSLGCEVATVKNSGLAVATEDLATVYPADDPAGWILGVPPS